MPRAAPSARFIGAKIVDRRSTLVPRKLEVADCEATGTADTLQGRKCADRSSYWLLAGCGAEAQPCSHIAREVRSRLKFVPIVPPYDKDAQSKSATKHLAYVRCNSDVYKLRAFEEPYEASFDPIKRNLHVRTRSRSFDVPIAPIRVHSRGQMAQSSRSSRNRSTEAHQTLDFGAST